MNTINERIEDGVRFLVRDGASVKKIRAYLTMEDVSDKESILYIKSLGLSGKKAGFTNEFNNWLAEKPRTLSECEEVIMGLGELGETTDNTKNHKSLYMNTAKLAIRIWDSAVGASTGRKMGAGESAAWDLIDTIKAEIAEGKKPKATRIHPDKVAKFENDELTKAYTKLYQEMTK